MADASAASRRRVLVVGGAGVFGARLVDGLLRTTDFDVTVAGRNPARLRAFAAGRDGARLATVAMDARAVRPEALRATGAFVVVDAAGPFQGAAPDLARAAIAAGCITWTSRTRATSWQGSRRSTRRRAPAAWSR